MEDQCFFANLFPFLYLDHFLKLWPRREVETLNNDGTTYFTHHPKWHRSESDRETRYFGSQPFIHVNEVRVKLVFWIEINIVMNIKSCFPRVYPLPEKSSSLSTLLCEKWFNGRVFQKRNVIISKNHLPSFRRNWQNSINGSIFFSKFTYSHFVINNKNVFHIFHCIINRLLKVCLVLANRRHLKFCPCNR